LTARPWGKAYGRHTEAQKVKKKAKVGAGNIGGGRRSKRGGKRQTKGWRSKKKKAEPGNFQT